MDRIFTNIGQLQVSGGQGDYDQFVKISSAAKDPLDLRLLDAELHARYSYRGKPGHGFGSRVTLLPYPSHDDEAIAVVHHQMTSSRHVEIDPRHTEDHVDVTHALFIADSADPAHELNMGFMVMALEQRLRTECNEPFRATGYDWTQMLMGL